jgi:hypothetical protein
MPIVFVIRRLFPWMPGQTPRSHNPYLRAFATRASADECCASLDRAERLRREVNPFDYGPNLDDCTSFPPPILCDWLLESGLTPPENAWEWQYTWRDWWLVVAERATELQIARIWQAMDKIRFFAVEAVSVIGDKEQHRAYLLCLCREERTMRSAEQDDEVVRAYEDRHWAETVYSRYALGDYGYIDFREFVFDIVELPLEE